MATLADIPAQPAVPTGRELRRQERRLTGGGRAPLWFLAPFALLFFILFALPIGYAAYQALFDLQRSGLGFGAPTEEFVGSENFTRALDDPAFREGIGRVLLYSVIQIPLMLGLALGLALLLDARKVVGRRMYRLVFFLPYAVPAVIAALLWGYLYSPSLSPIIRGVEGLGFGQPRPLDPDNSLLAVVNIGTWQATGYFMLILVAALQSIPRQLYEAAEIEGAGELRTARHIKLPLIAPALVLSGLFAIIGALQLFNEPRVLSAISNGISSDWTPNIYAYTVAFASDDANYAAALAVVLALATAILSFVFLRATRRSSGL
jgi:multiple sugar transport system permease protein